MTSSDKNISAKKDVCPLLGEHSENFLGMLISVFPKTDYHFEKKRFFSIVEFLRRYLTMPRAIANMPHHAMQYRVIAILTAYSCRSVGILQC